MNNLALWLIEDKEYASAEPLLREALELRRKLLGPEHADVAASMTLLAALLVDTPQYEEARSLAGDAKTICAEAFSPDHWRTASAASAEGAALAGLQRYAEAEPVLLESFNTLRNDSGALPFYVSNASRWLADLYRALGRPDEAAKYQVVKQ
jgi:tetratricopeptide (TPR) repeat protein